jgi:[pyruvate, water dikinase]-phosphate phosphotransferase / [pyruvate, water dikinase] kinase
MGGDPDMEQSETKPLLIVIVSGSTGRTAEQVVRAALAQFGSPTVRILKQSNVRTVAEARQIVRGLDREDAIICHSLVSPAVRDAVIDEAQRRMIPIVDILGRVLAVLSDYLGVTPQHKPGLSYELQKEYFDRIDAVSFTLEHDDGAGAATLALADVVLVGVSRVSKSVTCFYLGYRGIRAANVPLIPGLPPPDQLLQLPPEKVVGLTATPSRLRSVREARRHRLGEQPSEYYVEQEEVARELRYALKLMRKHHWRCIDVSYMAVEEVAVQVMQMIGR